VTVTEPESEPTEFEHVRVYVLSLEKEPIDTTSLPFNDFAPDQSPEAVQELAWDELQINSTSPPNHHDTLEGEAMIETDGATGGVYVQGRGAPKLFAAGSEHVDGGMLHCMLIGALERRVFEP
jgi:hypothetical protein